MSEVSSSSNSVEANRQNFNIDWRAKKPVFDEQMSHFCMKEEMADVEFIFNRNNEITVCFSIPFLVHYIKNFRRFLRTHLHLP